MNKLTGILGKHLEFIGEFCETDARITQNPAFLRMVQLKEEDKICIADQFGPAFLTVPLEISNCYDSTIEVDSVQKFYLKGQPILIAGPNSIVICQGVKACSDHFTMMDFHLDPHGNLHVKTTGLFENMIEVSNSIYDEHGIELQRDCLTDALSKSFRKSFREVLSISKDDSVGYANILREFFLQFQFDCALGKAPVYKPSRKSKYSGSRRDMRHFEFVYQTVGSDISYRERLDITYSLATMGKSCPETYPATKEEIAKSIALEENEETRNALIAYCASRGVTKEMVSGFGKEHKLQ